MYGKMTTSRMGIIGSRRVSDFSLEVSILFEGTSGQGLAASKFRVTGPWRLAPALSGLFQKVHVDLLGQHHLFRDQELADLLIGRQIVHQIQHQILEDHAQASRSEERRV